MSLLNNNNKRLKINITIIDNNKVKNPRKYENAT